MFSLWCSGSDGILIACTPAEIGRDFPWCTATCAWPPLPTPMTSESPFLAVFIREKGEETVRVWHYFFLSSGLSFCLWSPHTHSHTHTYIHTHSGNDCRKSSCDVSRRAAATARKLVFQVTALGNFRKAGCTAADIVAYGCTHIHTHAGRWIGVQIVSDMLISSPSLTADASAIKVKARERQPSRLSSSTSSSFSFLPLSSCRGAFQGVTVIKEMFHVTFCSPPPVLLFDSSPHPALHDCPPPLSGKLPILKVKPHV